MTTLARDHWITAFDGLRACAAMAVFGVHFQQITQVDPGFIGPFDPQRALINGNVGVSLFFTLSGFLLSMPLWRAKTGVNRPPAIDAYWLRRIVRIVPAYYLCLTALLIWNGALFDADEFTNVLLHYLFVFNYSNDYFYDFNPPFWTLAVEMQFYVLLPLMFMLVRRCRTAFAWFAFVALAVIAYGAHVALLRGIIGNELVADAMLPSGAPGVVLTHSLLAHLPHFLFGVIAAGYQIITRGRAEAGGYSLGADVICVIAVVGTFALVGTDLGIAWSPDEARYFWPLQSLAFVVLLLAAPRAPFVGGLLGSAPLRYAGRISYGIYLFHYPVMRLVEKLLAVPGIEPGTHPGLFALASLVLTVALASASYFALERPLQRRGARLARAREQHLHLP